VKPQERFQKSTATNTELRYRKENEETHRSTQTSKALVRECKRLVQLGRELLAGIG
jgi:hypothetical protein